MKSYKHLYDICISEGNRRRAIKQAKRTKRVRRMLKQRHMSDDELLVCSREWILQYENAEHKPVRILDGTSQKLRTIIVPTLEEIIDVTDSGIPLGFYTSQWLSNWFLQDLDHYVKEKLHAVYYVRYMDDMVIFGSNKKLLHQMRQATADYLSENLGLELKDDWQVFRFSYTVKGEDRGRFLDFMGFQFYRNRTVLRKSIMLKGTRKARRIHKKPYQGRKPTVHDYRQMMSYLGWIDCTNTYKMYLKHIKPRISFKKMKRYISRYDKYDPKRIYEKLIRRYAPKGGMVQNGDEVYPL